MKIIYLARHAKSSWSSGASNDFDRPLSNRGFADAEKMGKQLQHLEIKPEKIISSTALRAKQTCESYCEQLNIPLNEIEWNSEIYAAYTVTLLQILTAQPKAIKSIMLVGHNPAMEDLIVHLCGESAVNIHRQKNGKLLTTGNVAKIIVSVPWQQLVMHDAQLQTLLRPKTLGL
ncbi:MAG: histidine phosphatase family protein [Cocleimonas sp.]